MRVGLVCPYTWDVPGGVQAHVRDLAEALIHLGHQVSVLTPADEDELAEPLPPYVVSAGRAVPVPYNGSVARLAFGVLSATRVRRWVREGRFDVLHVHEPAAPSLSLLACFAARGPIVATFHSSNPRSRALSAASGVLQPAMEKIGGRIAVSEAARRFLVEHLGGDAVLIPNGVAMRSFSGRDPLPGWPGPGGALGFLGRVDEPRKGFDLLLEAFRTLGTERPGLRLLVAGPGEADEVRSLPRELRERVVLLGRVTDEDKARMLHSVDVYVAPNTGGESFGIILLEAMACGTPVLASGLEAFERVLDHGAAGVRFPVGDSAALAREAAARRDDPARRSGLARAGLARARGYDWPRVAADVVTVYETVMTGLGPVTEEPDEALADL